MKRLYEKNELIFSIVWIVAYVLLMSVADALSAQVGIEKVFTAPLSVALSVVLIAFVYMSGDKEKFGLIKGRFPAKTYLFFVPLIVMVSVNFWGGVCVQLTVLETVLSVLSMLCVGVIEEVIFRGFLFRAMSEDNLTAAIIVSSITFGFGHIVNLLSGAEILPTLLQIAYATAAGFMFTIVFYKSGSILPCIATHSLVNAASVFACEPSFPLELITAGVLIVASVGYALWILYREKTDKKDTNAEE